MSKEGSKNNLLSINLETIIKIKNIGISNFPVRFPSQSKEIFKKINLVAHWLQENTENMSDKEASFRQDMLKITSNRPVKMLSDIIMN